MVKLGMIGLSEGNGHPYSFSAILNGFNEEAFTKSGWPGILKYLKKNNLPSNDKIDAKVEYIWTQDINLSKKIADSCYIPNIASHYLDFIGNIDAVIIARDDYKNHVKMAKEFLDYKIPVFIDKPLTLNFDELCYFESYLKSGLLMSCSGFRYCEELDLWRSGISEFKNIKLLQATIINGWNKYGIHMIDAILSLEYAWPEYFEPIKCASHEAVNITMSDGSLCQINALGPEIPTFSISIYGTNKHDKTQITNNFIAFKRMLKKFIEQVDSGSPVISPNVTLLSIKSLIAGRMALDSGKPVYLDSLG